MIYDAQISSIVQKGGHPSQLNDTVSSSTSSDDVLTESSDDGDEERFERGLNESTHRESLVIHGIQYYECFRVASLWFNSVETVHQEQETN
jgi:hypothetical protein